MSTHPTTKKQQVNPSKELNPNAKPREKKPEKYPKSRKLMAAKNKAQIASRDKDTALFTPEPETDPVLKPVLKLEFEDLSDKLNEIGRIDKMGRLVSETFELADIESEGDEPLEVSEH
jgi:hypothetical protein|uniref:Uncharacterized protein n=1 Tax=viral metagenome TaxID=1070528 RepID=A0A6C0AGS2_9ZZZZ